MTFTVVARDMETGLLGVAQATNPLSVGARCPFIRANVGAVSSQAYTDPGLGPLAIELLTLGHAPKKVLAEIEGSDDGWAWRQVGIVDRHGRAAVGTDLPHHLIGRQRIGLVIHRHRVTALRRQQAGGRAYASPTTGDQQNSGHAQTFQQTGGDWANLAGGHVPCKRQIRSNPETA